MNVVRVNAGGLLNEAFSNGDLRSTLGTDGGDILAVNIGSLKRLSGRVS